MFLLGDKVVYPMHGAGIVTKVEKRELKGELVDYIILKMVLGNMTMMIPAENAEKLGLRPLITAEQLKEIEVVLKSRPENVMRRINWNRRFNIYQNKIKSGDVLEVTDVVRTLTIQEQLKKLSTGERRLLNTARSVLLSEITIYKDINEEEAQEWLDGFFVHI